MLPLFLGFAGARGAQVDGDCSVWEVCVAASGGVDASEIQLCHCKELP